VRHDRDPATVRPAPGAGTFSAVFAAADLPGVGKVRCRPSPTIATAYIETTGDQTPESIINVYSDRALTAADFVL